MENERVGWVLVKWKVKMKKMLRKISVKAGTDNASEDIFFWQL